MENKKCLVTGATGGIGRAVVKALSDKNIAVRLLVRNREKAEMYFGEFNDVEILKGDASNENDLKNAMDGISHYFYCVNIPYEQWEEKAVDLLGKSLTAAASHKAKFVFPGNVYVYGHAQYNPVDEDHPFAAHTKKGRIRIQMERMLHEAYLKKGLRYTIVRMPDFYGPFVINTFSEKFYINALRGKPLQWFGDLDIPVEFIYIEDGGKAMAEAGLSENTDGKDFNVPGYSETTARKYLEEIAKQGGNKSKIKSINSPLIVGLAGLFNPTAREFKEMMYLKQEKLILSGKRYQETIGEYPKTAYSDGIKKTLEWVKDYFDIN